MPIELNGQTVGDITLNGNTIGEVTVNGTTVFKSGISSQLLDVADHVWLMDEGAGNTIVDTVGSADGTLQSGVEWNTGVGTNNVYLDFTNTTDFVDVGNILSGQIPNFTFAFWAEVVPGDQRYIAQQNVTDFLFQQRGGSDQGMQAFWNGSNLDTTVDITPGWKMMCFTVDNTSFEYYIYDTSGIEDTLSSTTNSLITFSSGDTFTIGNRLDKNRSWNAGIDLGVLSFSTVSQSVLDDHHANTKDFYS